MENLLAVRKNSKGNQKQNGTVLSGDLSKVVGNALALLRRQVNAVLNQLPIVHSAALRRFGNEVCNGQRVVQFGVLGASACVVHQQVEHDGDFMSSVLHNDAFNLRSVHLHQLTQFLANLFHLNISQNGIQAKFEENNTIIPSSA